MSKANYPSTASKKRRPNPSGIIAPRLRRFTKNDPYTPTAHAIIYLNFNFMKEIFEYENDRNHLISPTKGGSPIEENGDEGDDREI